MNQNTAEYSDTCFLVSHCSAEIESVGCNVFPVPEQWKSTVFKQRIAKHWGITELLYNFETQVNNQKIKELLVLPTLSICSGKIAAKVPDIGINKVKEIIKDGTIETLTLKGMSLGYILFNTIMSWTV